ncbi:MAG: hypothetical protein WC979_02915 [Candidatus Pacearchaeota archaeon]|jgi:hypothetical protein
MIALAPAHPNQMPNYTGWLDSLGLKYHILESTDLIYSYIKL